MKSVAVMALKKGMVLGQDVLNFKNELLVAKNTTVDDVVLAKLNRHSIMVVEVMEEIDFATTHFEKVRLSEGFKKFVETYKPRLETYKKMINGLIDFAEPLDVSELFNIYNEIAACAKTGETLLDYLYNMLPSEDDLTYAHCLNAALIAGVFGTWLGYSKEDEQTLILCGFLYDIGKFTLSNNLIWKPGKLTDEEYALMKTHPMRGYHIIKDQNVNANVIKATQQHHERCDGTGYPRQLKDDDINIFAKTISIIDAYEAMTSARTYRETLIPFQVIANFENTGAYYSNIILKPILSHIASTQLGMTVRLSDGCTAEIILANQTKLSRPLVKAGEMVIDLSKRKDLEIVAVL